MKDKVYVIDQELRDKLSQVTTLLDSTVKQMNEMHSTQSTDHDKIILIEQRVSLFAMVNSGISIIASAIAAALAVMLGRSR